NAVYQRRLEVHVELNLGGATLSTIHGVADERIELDLFTVGVGPRAASEFDDVRHHLGQLVEFGEDGLLKGLPFPRRQAPRFEEDLDVAAQRGDRSAQLVRGIGDEIALRFDRLFERVERLVEAGRQPLELCRAGLVQMAGAFEFAGHLLGPAQEALDRSERGTRNRQAEQTGNQHAARNQQPVGGQEAIENGVNARQRQRYQYGPVVAGVAATQDPQVLLAHRRGRERAAARPHGELDGLRV